MCDALVKAFSSSKCTFEIPDGGMFLWLRFKSQKEVRIDARMKHTSIRSLVFAVSCAMLTSSHENIILIISHHVLGMYD